MRDVEMLTDTARKLNRQSEETEEVLRSLSYLSGTDGVRQELRAEKERLEENKRGILDMLLALERSLQCYTDTERRIVDNGEGVQITYEPTTVEMITNRTQNVTKVNLI